MSAQVSKELAEPWHSGAHIPQLPASGWQQENKLGLPWPVQPCWRSQSLMFLLVPGMHMDIVSPKPGSGFPAQPTLLCAEPEQPTGSQLCPSADGMRSWHSLLRTTFLNILTPPRVFGKTSVCFLLCPSWDRESAGKVLSQGTQLAVALNNAWKGGWGKNSSADGVETHPSSSSSA